MPLARRRAPELKAAEDDPFSVDLRDVDGGELAMLRASAMDVIDPAALVPPFEYVRLDDGAVRWRDAHGCEVGEANLYRWRMRLHSVVPADYATKAEYEAAWDGLDAEIEAAKAHAHASAHAAGAVFDDARRRWVQRPRAV